MPWPGVCRCFDGGKTAHRTAEGVSVTIIRWSTCTGVHEVGVGIKTRPRQLRPGTG